MPDNPNVPTLLSKARGAMDAQQKLRDSMAVIASASRPAQQPAAASGGSQ